MTVSDLKSSVFDRAWKIIEQDASIPPENKEGILKLIQALIEAAESFPAASKESQVKTFTQEIVSKHALMNMVKQQAEELNALQKIALNLTSSLNLQTVLNTVVSEALRLVRHSHSAYIYLYFDGQLMFGASLNESGAANQLTIPRSNGITNAAVKREMPIIIQDVAAHPLYADANKTWQGSIISIPLKADNQIVGVMNLSRSIKGEFTKPELRLLTLLADQAALAISNARLHKMVTDLANMDMVTGLPNRRALDERLQEELRYAKRMNSPFAVVMMDMDGFKNVNDIFGHAVGDEVLRSLFNYLAGLLRDVDFLARYGGDELTLVMRNTDLSGAEVVTAKMIDALKSFEFPFPNQQRVELGITAGIAVYPLHTRIPGDLLRAADSALYQGKKHKRGTYVVAKKSTGPLDAAAVKK